MVDFGIVWPKETEMVPIFLVNIFKVPNAACALCQGMYARMILVYKRFFVYDVFLQHSMAKPRAMHVNEQIHKLVFKLPLILP